MHGHAGEDSDEFLNWAPSFKRKESLPKDTPNKTGMLGKPHSGFLDCRRDLSGDKKILKTVFIYFWNILW